MRTSNREWILLAASIASLAPLPAVAETFGFKIEKQGAKVTCSRNTSADAADPADAVVVKLTRPADVAPDAQLVPKTEPDAPAGNPVAPQPGATKTDVEWKVLKNNVAGLTLVIVDPKNKDVKCSAVPSVAAAAGPTDRKPLDVDSAAWWQQNGTAELKKLASGGSYPGGTQFLVHYDNGDPAPPYPSALTERGPIQIAVIARPGKTPTLTLNVTSCEKVVPFRIREPPPAGAPQADKAQPPALVAYGPLLRCGAGTFSYALGIDDASSSHSLRVRPVSHLAFTTAYGFDLARIPTYSVENGKVAGTSDRAGLGLRLGLTWFPFGIDYEDMKPWNYVNPVFAVDPVTPTENFLVGGAITPTGGFALLVGANFRRLTVLRGTTVGADITGTEVPTTKEWNKNGIGLYIGLSVDDDVFKAVKGRLGQ